MTARTSLTRFLVPLLGDLWLAAAGAANLQISPVMINFRIGQGAAGINLQNMGETPIYGQVRVFIWDRTGTEEVLTPTREVVVFGEICAAARSLSWPLCRSPVIPLFHSEKSHCARLAERSAKSLNPGNSHTCSPACDGTGMGFQSDSRGYGPAARFVPTGRYGSNNGVRK